MGSASIMHRFQSSDWLWAGVLVRSRLLPTGDSDYVGKNRSKWTEFSWSWLSQTLTLRREWTRIGDSGFSASVEGLH